MPNRFRRVIHLAFACLVAGSSSGARLVAQTPMSADTALTTHANTHANTRALRRTLDSLYAAFSFDAGRAPNWQQMRALMLPGAAFVDPVKPSTPPHAIGADEFLANFRRWVEETPKGKAGFKERIVAVRIDWFGHIAHAYVTFEGYVAGEAIAKERGVDSIQLVRDGARWKVVSFTTQYEQPGQPIPRRFGGTR